VSASTPQIIALARKGGYEVCRVEQPRPNRWVLMLRTPEGVEVLALVQDRPLIGASDVADLAELLRLRRLGTGFLLALSGRFSPEAHRVAGELRQARIQLCTSLPSHGGAPGVAALEPVRS
jgi:hypothetical protein